mmetsp:Transcript_99663/g.310434  ORF Transcript_99663/g.310434 Transcript_99663/m.310434 type:complete len:271 (-) Transcript_99663:99-911(-)
MSSLLVVLARAVGEVADLAHVRVAPAAGARAGLGKVGGVHRAVGLTQDVPNVRADVTASPEEVHGAEACLEVGPAVVAVLDAYRLPRGVEQVGPVRDVIGRAAAVDLDAVEAEAAHPLDVLLVVRRKAARLHAYAVVEVGAHLQPEGVAVVHHGLHVWEPVLPDPREPRLVVPRAVTSKAEAGAGGQGGVDVLAHAAVAALPTIVHAHPVEAEIRQTGRPAADQPGPVDDGRHLRRHARLGEDPLVLHAVEGVPGAPAAGRRQADAVVDR